MSPGTVSALTPMGPDCRQELAINSSWTTIKNPGYPGYDHNMDCQWILTSDPLSRIEVKILRMVLESSTRCRYDALEIYDGLYGQQNWNKTASLCRRNQVTARGARGIVSSGNAMRLRFKTDRSVSRTGFIVRVRSSK